MSNAIIRIIVLVAVFVITGFDLGYATEFGAEPPPDEDLVRRVEERVELLRKWRVIEAIDPSPELADQLFPLLSHHERTERELNREREHLTGELRRILYEERANDDHLDAVMQSLARIRNDRCRLQQHLDDELAGLLTTEQRARLTIVLDDFHREVQQLIQRARHRPDGMNREPLRGMMP